MQQRILSEDECISTAIPSSEQQVRLSWMLEYLHSLASPAAFQRMAHALRDGEMSFSQLNALYQLHHEGPQTIADIARWVNLSHNAASRMVDRLVQGGLVERNEVPTDRRQKRVELTQAGIDWLYVLQTTTANSYAALLAQIPAAELDRLAEVLERVNAYLPAHPMLVDSPLPIRPMAAGEQEQEPDTGKATRARHAPAKDKDDS